MCGIFGIQSVRASDITNPFVNKISSLMNRRGPNATGFYGYNKHEGKTFLTKSFEKDCALNVFFMHKRLSILDLSEAGTQPMQSADGRYTLVFNGEIYNYKQLRKQLEKKGITFSTNCDTEVLLQYLIHVGTNHLQALEGMFAFALFDKLENKLFLARDPFGIKPLYLFKTPEFFAFSSQINCLMEMQNFGPRYLEEEVYLPSLRYGAVDYDERTLVKNALRLQPGHCLTVQLNESILTYQEETYFKWEEKNTEEIDTIEHAIQSLREKLTYSVEEHLISDVPVCFNLSGGVDSSALVAIASKIHRNITAFTYAADEYKLDESRYAECVAKHCNIQLIKVKINPKDFGQDLDAIIGDQGEPYGGSSIYAQRKLYEVQKKEGFKVCIDGQGGDELFAGYANYFALRVRDVIKTKKWGNIFLLFKNMPSKAASALAYIISNSCAQYPNFVKWFRRIIGRDLCPFYLDRTFFEDHSYQLKIPQYSSLRECLDDSLLRTSIPGLVRYADRNAMAFSIENRVPFLCNSVAQFAHHLPNEYLISNKGWQKYILRESVKDLLPENITYRKDKMGFPPTEGLWLLSNKEQITKILQSETLRQFPGILPNKVTNFWEAAKAKNEPTGWRTDILWKFINIVRWVELNNINVRFQ